MSVYIMDGMKTLECSPLVTLKIMQIFIILRFFICVKAKAVNLGFGF